MINWYVIQTQVKMEPTAKENLVRQGFDVFLPQYEKKVKKGLLTLPLFPGYLFTRFDPAVDRWQRIHSTTGVSRILGYNAGANTICPVKPDVVPGLQAFCDPDTGVIDLERAYPKNIERFKEGDKVKILEGIFAGKHGTYWNGSPKGAHIILQLLNRPIRVILRNEEITLG